MKLVGITFLLCFSLLLGCSSLSDSHSIRKAEELNISRPLYLINEMTDGQLKRQLQACSNQDQIPSTFSIGHRGALKEYPEHTLESYMAAIEQGAGRVECDIQMTQDNQLVCRHSSCDLHETTNILDTPLSSICTQDEEMKCCVSDLTLEQFKTLSGKSNKGYGQLMSHAESVELLNKHNIEFIPELKSLNNNSKILAKTLVDKVISEYLDKSIEPEKVWLQSGDIDIVRELLLNQSPYTNNLVFLDYRYTKDSNYKPKLIDFLKFKSLGINNIAPPIYQLLDLDENDNIIASDYAVFAEEAGLVIYTWTLERSGHLIDDMKEGGGSRFYYQSILPAINTDGDVYSVLDVLAKDVGIEGIFSDWPETVTYYANCMGM